MAQETERKFLVAGAYKHLAYKKFRITQGYLSTVAERTVRIRIKDDKAFITIKGSSNASGITRYEWEKEIPVNEALELLQLCEPGKIDKTRYLIQAGKHTYEVDEFYGENQGLVMAEIELTSEDEAFIKPEWLGQEVTGNPDYFNSSLIVKPFSTW